MHTCHQEGFSEQQKGSSLPQSSKAELDEEYTDQESFGSHWKSVSYRLEDLATELGMSPAVRDLLDQRLGWLWLEILGEVHHCLTKLVIRTFAWLIAENLRNPPVHMGPTWRWSSQIHVWHSRSASLHCSFLQPQCHPPSVFEWDPDLPSAGTLEQDWWSSQIEFQIRKSVHEHTLANSGLLKQDYVCWTQFLGDWEYLLVALVECLQLQNSCHNGLA